MARGRRHSSRSGSRRRSGRGRSYSPRRNNYSSSSDSSRSPSPYRINDAGSRSSRRRSSRSRSRSKKHSDRGGGGEKEKKKQRTEKGAEVISQSVVSSLPSKPEVGENSMDEEEVVWIRVAFQLDAKTPVPGDVPEGVALGTLLEDFLDAHQSSQIPSGSISHPRRLVAALINGECVSATKLIDNSMAGGVIAPVFSDEPEGLLVLNRSIALLASIALREVLAVHDPGAVSSGVRLVRESNRALLFEMTPNVLSTPDLGLTSGLTDWSGDNPYCHPSIVTAEYSSYLEKSSTSIIPEKLAAALEKQMITIVTEGRPFTQLQHSYSQAIAMMEGKNLKTVLLTEEEKKDNKIKEDDSSISITRLSNSGLRLLKSNQTANPVLTSIEPTDNGCVYHEVDYGVVLSQTSDLIPSADFHVISAKSVRDASSSSSSNSLNNNGILVCLYPLSASLSGVDALNCFDESNPTLPWPVLEVVTEAQSECAAVHGLDCAAAVNSRISRSPGSSIIPLVQDLGAAKLRRVADQLVAAGIQVVLVGGAVGSGTHGVATTLASYLAACAMPSKVLNTCDFLLSKTKNGSVTQLLSDLIDEKGGIDEQALKEAVSSALASAQTSGLRCLIIQGLHALDSQAVNLQALGLGHLAMAAVFAAPLTPIRISELKLLHSDDIRSLRVLSHCFEQTSTSMSLNSTDMASNVLSTMRQAIPMEAKIWQGLNEHMEASALGLTVVDTSSPFEAGLLRTSVEGLLRGVSLTSNESATARRLLRDLSHFDPLSNTSSNSSFTSVLTSSPF